MLFASGVQDSSRRLSSPRRDLNATPSTPMKSPRSTSSISRRCSSSPSTSARECSWIVAGAVAEVEEGRLAVAAPGHQPAGDRVALLGLLAVGEGLVRGADVGDRLAARELRREGLEAALALPLELGAALGEQRGLGRLVCGFVTHRRARVFNGRPHARRADRDQGRNRRRPAPDLRDLQRRGRARDRDLRRDAEGRRWPTPAGSTDRDEIHPVLVAIDGGELVGWASIGPWSPKGAYRRTGEVSVYVDEPARGRGIGRLLLREPWSSALAAARSGSCSPAWPSRTRRAWRSTSRSGSDPSEPSAAAARSWAGCSTWSSWTCTWTDA